MYNPNKQLIDSLDILDEEDRIYRLFGDLKQKNSEIIKASSINSPETDPYEHAYSFSGSVSDLIEIFLKEREYAGLDAVDVLVKGPLFVRSAIEYKIEHPNMPNSIELVRAAVDLFQKIVELYYLDFKQISYYIGIYLKILADLGLKEDMLKRTVTQTGDSATINVAIPYNLRQSERRMSLLLNGEKVLFIPMANGALATGMATFILSRVKGTINEDSVIYPVRFSTLKKKDTVPSLSNDERAMILDYASKGYSICIFEEDMLRGFTMEEMFKYLQSFLPSTTKIVPNWCVNNSPLFWEFYS